MPINYFVNMGCLWVASSLIVCSTSVRVDAEYVQVPAVITGLDKAVSSPDSRYELIWKRNDRTEKHEIWLRPGKDPVSQALLYSYVRNAEVLWSPDSVYVAITDRVGSSESFVKVFQIQSPTDFTEMKGVPQYIEKKYLTGKDGTRIFSHEYSAISRWSIDSRFLEIEVRAYDPLDGSQRSLRKRIKVPIPMLVRSFGPPLLPYFDWNACPFEGCQYGEWSVCKTTPIRKKRDKNAPIVFKVKKGTTIRAETGVVVTARAGIVKVVESITMDEEHPVSLKPGDVFYTLHYQGEGFDLFWFKGELHSAQMEYHNDLPGVVKDAFTRVVREPKYDWWVQIRDSAGQFGWTNDVRNFGMSGCE